MSVNCWLCRKESFQKNVQLRSKKEAIINYCIECHFEFFEYDNFNLLSSDQLDKTRLESAGLDIPKQEKDFQNGYTQSLNYINEYFYQQDIGQNILEIGCSWGYFLKRAQEFGCVPSGVEINPVRSEYVKNILHLPCENSVEKYIENNKKFKKIFSFYCLEYVRNPIGFFEQLIQLLDVDGEIIFITPNLDDVLKDIWHNKAYKDFFYDECAVAYYSLKSALKLSSSLTKTHSNLDCDIKTQQGYSIYNHLYWFFNQKPVNNNCLVGGDQLAQTLDANLRNSENCLGESLGELINSFNNEYKKIIEKHHLGNQIVIRIRKRHYL